MNLEKYRNEIDSIDAEIVALLNRRGDAARNIGLIKAKAGLPIVDRHRENEILRRVTDDTDGIVDCTAIARVYGEILLESRRIQNAAMKELLRRTEVL